MNTLGTTFIVKHYAGDENPLIKTDVGIDIEVHGGTRELADEIAKRLKSNAGEDCPRCDGSGEEEVMDSDGPDADLIMVNCTHCGGVGSLSAAYKHLLSELTAANEKYLDACGKLYFANLAERALEPQGQALPEWKRLNYDSEAAYWRAKFNEAQTTIKAHQAVLESVKEERDALASQLALPAGPVPLTKDQQEAIEGGIRALRMHSDGFISKMFRKELQTMLDAAAQTDAEFDALRAAAIEACSWLDHANCVNLPVDDDNTSMRASMNKLRDMAWKTLRRTEPTCPSPAVAQPVADERALLKAALQKIYNGRYCPRTADRLSDTQMADIAAAALCQPAEEGDKA